MASAPKGRSFNYNYIIWCIIQQKLTVLLLSRGRFLRKDIFHSVSNLYLAKNLEKSQWQQANVSDATFDIFFHFIYIFIFWMFLRNCYFPDKFV